MSITTKRGDDGETDLLFGRRQPKTSLRMTALGAVDELNSALGIARTAGMADDAAGTVDTIQETLVALMGQLATLPGDEERHRQAGYGRVEDAHVTRIEEWITGLEQSGVRHKGWARPGADAPPVSAHLDFCRAIARRAEREVRRVHEDEASLPDAPLIFLNRLSDLLWLMARREAMER